MAAASQIVSPFVPTLMPDLSTALTPFGIGNGNSQPVEIPQAFRHGSMEQVSVTGNEPRPSVSPGVRSFMMDNPLRYTARQRDRDRERDDRERSSSARHEPAESTQRLGDVEHKLTQQAALLSQIQDQMARAEKAFKDLTERMERTDQAVHSRMEGQGISIFSLNNFVQTLGGPTAPNLQQDPRPFPDLGIPQKPTENFEIFSPLNPARARQAATPDPWHVGASPWDNFVSGTAQAPMPAAATAEHEAVRYGLVPPTG